MTRKELQDIAHTSSKSRMEAEVRIQAFLDLQRQLMVTHWQILYYFSRFGTSSQAERLASLIHEVDSELVLAHRATMESIVGRPPLLDGFLPRELSQGQCAGRSVEDSDQTSVLSPSSFGVGEETFGEGDLFPESELSGYVAFFQDSRNGGGYAYTVQATDELNALERVTEHFTAECGSDPGDIMVYSPAELRRLADQIESGQAEWDVPAPEARDPGDYVIKD